MEYDGTIECTVTSEVEEYLENSSYEDANDFLDSYIDGPWPVFHILAITTITVLIHVTIDILQTMNIVELGFLGCFLDLFSLDTTPADNF